MQRTFLKDKEKRKNTVKLWRLNEDGRKLFAGTIKAGDPRELGLKWSLFLATADRGTYFATYREVSSDWNRTSRTTAVILWCDAWQGPHRCRCVSADEFGGVGGDKDSEHRQRAAVRTFAKRAGLRDCRC